MLLCAFVFVVMATAAGVLSGTCDYDGSNREVKCHDFTNADDLASVVNKTVSPDINYRGFYLKNMKLDFIRFDTFKAGYEFPSLLIENSTFGALTDRGRAFMGLEKSLQNLHFIDSTFTNKLDWGIFNKLKYIAYFYVIGCNMSGLSGIEKLKLELVQDLILNNSGITELPSKAFVGLPNLNYLSLINNKIRVLERSMFQNPALRLWQLDLSNNRMEMIPDDLFQNMPALKFLYINGNKLLTLKEETFSPIWKQLLGFTAENIGLLCDFNLCWILQKYYFPRDTTATCRDPSYLRGRNITSLNSTELYC